MYDIQSTDTFLKELKKFKKNNQLLLELDKKIERLKEDPEAVGGRLSGKLHGLHSTRLIKNVRLIFRRDRNTVYLEAIDHRGVVYE